eukprot:gene1246-1586_t
MATLTLDRSLRNATFESWKIGRDFVGRRYCLNLPDDVYFGASESVDFQHTRASALHNHLLQSLGRLFVVVGDLHLRVLEVACNAGDDAQPGVVRLVKLAVVAQHAATAAVLDSSLPGSTTATAATPSTELVFSSGKGDLVLL